MKNIAEALDSLDDSDMERVERLVLKLAGRKGFVQAEKPTAPPSPAKQKVNRKPPPPRNQKVSQNNKSVKKKKTFSKREQLDVTSKRENKFLLMDEATMHTNDTKDFDRKVATKKPMNRKQRVSLVEAMCKGCEETFTIAASVVFNDPDLGPVFICDDCITRKD